jgi:hypothetical protein
MASERDELTDDERRALLELVHWEIENSRFPLSEPIRMLKRIRAKLRNGITPTAANDLLDNFGSPYAMDRWPGGSRGAPDMPFPVIVSISIRGRPS